MVSPYCISKVTASLKKQSHLSNKRLQLNESQRLATNAEQRGKNVNSGTRSSFHHSVMFCFADLSLNNSCWSRGSVHPRSDKALCACLGTWACLRPWTQSPAGECVLPWIFWQRTDGCSTHQHDILQQSQILTSVVVTTDVPHVSGREESLARRAVFSKLPIFVHNLGIDDFLLCKPFRFRKSPLLYISCFYPRPTFLLSAPPLILHYPSNTCLQSTFCFNLA